MTRRLMSCRKSDARNPHILLTDGNVGLATPKQAEHHARDCSWILHGRKMFPCIVAAGLCMWSSLALATACIVSDPYAHTGDQPLAGTYSTASGAASEAVALDTRVYTLFVSEGWSLSLLRLGFLCIIN